MRLRAMFGVCLSFALLAGGCDPVAENRLYREGIGTDLSRSDMAQVTRAQDIYLGYLCAQAGVPVVGSGDQIRCVDDGGSRSWSLVVQAGLNDIDQRCDAYLAWLDDKRRSHAPIIAQIQSLDTTTGALMRFAGAGASAITTVGSAFGLASQTFTNVRSRLLLEVNHSTVQAVVLSRRDQFRLNIKSTRFDNRPAAIHAMRSYLNICTPFTIEMDINTTVTAFQFGGLGALDRPPPIATDTIKVVAPTVVPVGPRELIGNRRPPPPPPPPEFAQVFEEYNPKVDTVSRLKLIQQALCVPSSESGKVGALTKSHIDIFEETYRPSRITARRNGRLDQDEITAIFGQKGACGVGIGSNYFERFTFTTPSILVVLVDDLRRFDAGKTLSAAPSVGDIRAAVRAVRDDPKIKPKLTTLLPESMRDQVTRDLWQALRSTQ